MKSCLNTLGWLPWPLPVDDDEMAGQNGNRYKTEHPKSVNEPKCSVARSITVNAGAHYSLEKTMPGSEGESNWSSDGRSKYVQHLSLLEGIAENPGWCDVGPLNRLHRSWWIVQVIKKILFVVESAIEFCCRRYMIN